MGESGQPTIWTIHIYETYHHRGGYSITKQHKIDQVNPHQTVDSFVARLKELGCDTSDIQPFDPSLLSSTNWATGEVCIRQEFQTIF